MSALLYLKRLSIGLDEVAQKSTFIVYFPSDGPIEARVNVRFNSGKHFLSADGNCFYLRTGEVRSDCRIPLLRDSLYLRRMESLVFISIRHKEGMLCRRVKKRLHQQCLAGLLYESFDRSRSETRVRQVRYAIFYYYRFDFESYVML